MFVQRWHAMALYSHAPCTVMTPVIHVHYFVEFVCFRLPKKIEDNLIFSNVIPKAGLPSLRYLTAVFRVGVWVTWGMCQMYRRGVKPHQHHRIILCIHPHHHHHHHHHRFVVVVVIIVIVIVIVIVIIVIIHPQFLCSFLLCFWVAFLIFLLWRLYIRGGSVLFIWASYILIFHIIY